MWQPPCLPRQKTFEVVKEQCAGKGPFSAIPQSLTPLLSAVRGSDLQDSLINSGVLEFWWRESSVYLEVLAKVL